jgi:hypothetical protein
MGRSNSQSGTKSTGGVNNIGDEGAKAIAAALAHNPVVGRKVTY